VFTLLKSSLSDLGEIRGQMATWERHQLAIQQEAEAAAARLKHPRPLEVDLPHSPDSSGEHPSASGEFAR
jgi:hypothetical protein